ncbi:HesA/MoeB/ThiF family protein [Zeaxanthinibacter sp. PT1]|uniref:HesA/MoeB/ThiF family protein n=1 Tax=Zeaxanthinibacter TaxID=561554 RepID=UPI00234928FB|nr:HesA/MoeB/ThiF family protein [Zeaxanthinibacter sp. PT1]MDC6351515.1 HesA/MoeB/ThiF family protein [Zeaxanthinibacter sp. PT1]
MKSNRYIRQTTLKSFGQEAQKKLADARVLIVGLGGLGLPVAQYLNAMGVGTLGLVDGDVVELHNLQRQVLYTEENCGTSKLEATIRFLEKQNSETNLKGHQLFLDRNNALDIIEKYDVIVDATDNFPARYLINDACVILGKPFIYGALHAFEGQLSVFNYMEGPTYRCLFPEMPKSGEIANCDQHGVLGVLPGIIGNLQALEAVKVITGIGQVLSGKLLLFDGLSQRSQQISYPLKAENRQIKYLANDYNSVSCDARMKCQEIELFLKELYDPDSDQLIDVRSTEEFREDHLPNAINIPLNVLDQNLDVLHPAKNVYLLCASGVRSQKAWELLKDHVAPERLIVIQGGMNTLRMATKQ